MPFRPQAAVTMPAIWREIDPSPRSGTPAQFRLIDAAGARR
jgi:hypothetical protein